MKTSNSELHETVKHIILNTSLSLGYKSVEEYRGKGWRADVYIETGNKKYAFEVQVSPQSLKKTQERQEKYIRDGITCCWLFEKETKNMKPEFEELPLFQLIQESNGDLYVSLKGRKKLSLENFVTDFLNNRIRFCKHIKRSPKIDVKFLKMPCYKCNAENYIYHIWPLKSTCNATLNYQDELWDSDKFVFHPEIVKKVKEYTNSKRGKHLLMGEIKERYSSMVDKTYMSFGCHKCDAIFGDFYVKMATIESFGHEEDVIEHLEIDINAPETMQEMLPHWCHPGDLDFCE